MDKEEEEEEEEEEVRFVRVNGDWLMVKEDRNK